MVGQANFTHDEPLTAVVEIEAIINACPLLYVSSEDQKEPMWSTGECKKLHELLSLNL